MTETTGTGAPEKRSRFAQDAIAARAKHAEALSALCRYSVARDAAEHYGDDLKDLPEIAASGYTIGEQYREAVQSIVGEQPDTALQASAFIELAMSILLDTLTGDLTDTGDMLSDESAAFYALALLANARSWTNKGAYGELVEAERKQFNERDAAVRRAADILVNDPGGAFKRAIEIVAEAEIVEREGRAR